MADLLIHLVSGVVSSVLLVLLLVTARFLRWMFQRKKREG